MTAKKDGVQIDKIEYIQEWMNDKHFLEITFDDKCVVLTTMDLNDEKQHDFLINKEDWNVLKTIVDFNLMKADEE